MLRFVLALCLLAALSAQAAGLKIAVLHPLLGDIARRVGGQDVEVIDLIGAEGDPHHFDPKPEDLQKAGGARLYLAAGLGLESYLPEIRGVLGGRAKLIEVGATLPPLARDEGGKREVDPHWWHSIDRFRRATGIVAAAMIEADPDHAAEFRANAAKYRAELDELETWTRREVGKIPRQNRQLATTHAAFGYFCADFGFQPMPLQGLSHEQTPGPAELAKLIGELRKNHVATIFPEIETNPKILQALTADTGIALGGALIADGAGGRTYQEMFRHNVEAIVAGLAPKSAK